LEILVLCKPPQNFVGYDNAPPTLQHFNWCCVGIHIQMGEDHFNSLV
jgi:hypothetical protein